MIYYRERNIAWWHILINTPTHSQINSRALRVVSGAFEVAFIYLLKNEKALVLVLVET